MTKRNCIIFDCDDILLDYMEGLKKFVEKHYDIYPAGYSTDYVLNEWLGVDEYTCQEIINHFNHNSYEFGLLKQLEDGLSTELLILYNHAKKHDTDLVVLTKSGKKGHGEVLRKVNLMNTFGDIFSEIIIIETNETKRASLLKLKSKYNVLCFVDDYVGNIDDGIKCGINSVLIERHHNVKHKGKEQYVFFKDWELLIDYLYELIKQ
ncbi:hypothetical protein XaC1_421 [Xanthomonas phage XaC1]|nr:hypothetical protein XaC1_421 [Xanthomonas phage XaC1]